MYLVYLRHSEKPGPNVVKGVCPQIGRNQKQGIFKSSGKLGRKCTMGSGAPAVLRFQPLSLFRELAQDRVGQPGLVLRHCPVNSTQACTQGKGWSCGMLFPI